MKRFKGVVRIESVEALDILHREFSNLQSELRNQETALQKSRKTNKLSKAEAQTIEVFDRALQNSQRAVEKEIEDVTRLTKKD
jgi:phage-related minor tail protein